MKKLTVRERLQEFAKKSIMVDYQKAGYLIEASREIEDGIAVYVDGCTYKITVTKEEK